MSVVVIAHLHARPGKEEDTRAALSELQAATHEEEGCLFYALHRNTEDPQEFTTIEKWSSPEAVGAHFETDHLKAVLGRVEELLDQAPDIRSYEALPQGDARGAL